MNFPVTDQNIQARHSQNISWNSTENCTTKKKFTNKIYFPYYVYDPYYESYGKEKDSYTEINIINYKKDEQTEPTVHKDKTFSPPRIVNLEDVAPNNTENVILIYGTKVIETTISSDWLRGKER